MIKYVAVRARSEPSAIRRALRRIRRLTYAQPRSLVEVIPRTDTRFPTAMERAAERGELVASPVTATYLVVFDLEDIW
jgi:hypothetical protein